MHLISVAKPILLGGPSQSINHLFDFQSQGAKKKYPFRSEMKRKERKKESLLENINF